MALKLPLQVVSNADVMRLKREVSGLNDYFTSAAARSAGVPAQPPRLSRQLDQLVRENQVNLMDNSARTKLHDDLKALELQAPMLHISFASEPSAQVVEKILSWLRSNIDPYVLLRVGLQPTIAAGCVLRTPNKIIDMSMRSSLITQEPYLAKLIAGAANE